MTTHKITWLLYHEPIDLFLRTAKAFSERIAERTNNRISVEIYTTKEYAEKFTNGIEFDPVSLLVNGHIQMSQVYINELVKEGASDFSALEMPFLFRDHDHCARVLEGEIGQFLFDKMQAKVDVKGLAFTYSGGYRVMATEKNITNSADFVGLEIAVQKNTVFMDTFEAFGCSVTPVDRRAPRESELAIKQTSKNIQTTLPRYKNEADPAVHKYIVNTEHNMYLTSIIIGTDFWQQLSDEDKLAIQETANECARLERKWTLEDAEKIATDTAEQAKLGIQSYKHLSAEDSDKLRQASKPLYDKYRNVFSPGLLDKILLA